MKKDTTKRKHFSLSSMSFLDALKPKINKAREGLSKGFRNRPGRQHTRFDARFLSNLTEH